MIDKSNEGLKYYNAIKYTLFRGSTGDTDWTTVPVPLLQTHSVPCGCASP